MAFIYSSWTLDRAIMRGRIWRTVKRTTRQIGERTGFCVTLETQHDLWCSVPSGGDILSHVACVFLGIHGESSCEPKIADLELAVSIYEQITRLQVSVQDIGGVNVLQSAQDLVNEGLEMCISEGLPGSNDSRQIALHEFCHDISAMSRCCS